MKEKYIKRFLIDLYDYHVQNHGDMVSNLEKSARDTYSILADIVFKEENSEYEQAIKGNLVALSKEIAERGWGVFDKSNLSVHLTVEGYNKAKEFKHPKKHMIRQHWKWAIGIVLTFVGVTVAVVELFGC